ncbi:MAG: hypothetical protein EOO46_15785 [Flavobacterium sp.]|nr:MAG: hypothetical protein EOO46_15785 [Flavobacterium sp.]
MRRNNYNFSFDHLKEVKGSTVIPVLFYEAKKFVQSHKWCRKAVTGWYDEKVSLLDKLGVFLFEIEPINADVDTYVWIIVGDLPSVYLVASIKTGEEALETYCELMEEWANNVLKGCSLDECYPVEAEPTTENAELLKSRTVFIRKEILLLPGD